jgi:hypothetical protein
LKKLALLLPLISLNCFAEENKQDKDYSIGLGLGAMYSGIGTNLSFVSENDLKYISAGCVEYSSRNGSTCGFGAGWIKTDLFGANSNKHGFGVYVSIVGNESYASYTSTTEGVEYYEHDSDIYGAGVSYTYFMNGINKSGTTFGVSIHATNADFEDSYGGFFQVGYQF